MFASVVSGGTRLDGCADDEATSVPPFRAADGGADVGAGAGSSASGDEESNECSRFNPSGVQDVVGDD